MEEEKKEHKKSWRETYATPAEIKSYLADHVYMRYNSVRHRVEVRLPPQDSFCANSELEQFAADDWQPLTDRLTNTLKNALCEVKPTLKRDLEDVLNSGFVPPYHPFGSYLEHLPPWDGQDYILELSATVAVKGDVDQQLLFASYLKKWLVAMVASWMDEEVVNQAVLVLIGAQGIYKTTWLSRLLPPELREYFRIKVKSNRVEKDDLIAMAQYGLVCYEELDVMRTSEVNTMKTVITMPSIDVRKPYGRHPEHMPHVASFCGTGNNLTFLNDSSGSRRWLPFEVQHIDSPWNHPINYEAVYAQAFALYRQGFPYYFSKAEEAALRLHNQEFETPHPEQEAILSRFRQPGAQEHGEFYTATDILMAISGGPSFKPALENIGPAMEALGIRRVCSHGRRGYRLVAYNGGEMEVNRRLLAQDARTEDEAGGAGGVSVY